ncbi:HNH endonuclease, partial [Subdoligranulum sp. AM16-9]
DCFSVRQIGYGGTGINMDVLYHLMNSPAGKQSVEYNDNRIALYVAQKGKCAVSGVELEANQVDCHHKKPLSLGGDDSYKNLIIVSDVVHILVHSSNDRTIRKYLEVFKPNKKQLEKLNKLRVLAEMPELTL